MSQDNVICINKILRINSTHEAFLRYVSAHIDYAMSAANADHADVCIDVLGLIRGSLPEPTQYDMDCFESELLDFYDRTDNDGSAHG